MGAHIEFSAKRRAAACLSDLTLDRLVAGEAVGAAAEAHAVGCEHCGARLAAFRADQARDAALVAELQANAKLPSVVPWKRRVWMATALPLFAAAAIILLLLPRLLHAPGEREKGVSSLALDVVVRHADGHIEALGPDGHVRPGDAVRFLVSTPRAGNLVILGLDAAGAVSVYVGDGNGPQHVERGARQAMPGSIILDATPGAERLVALECEARFAVSDAIDAGRKSLARAQRDPRRVGSLGLPGCMEATLTMDKSQ
jgi:hypothetical protein